MSSDSERIHRFKNSPVFTVLILVLIANYISSLIIGNKYYEGLSAILYIPLLFIWAIDWRNRTLEFMRTAAGLLWLILMFVIWVKVI